MKTNRRKPVRQWKASITLGRWFLAIPAGASFACLLTLMTSENPDYATEVAIICFSISLPLLGQYVLVLSDESRGHHPSALMRGIAVLGLISFMIGFVSMLVRVSTAAAALFALLSIAMILVLVASQDRAQARRGNSDREFPPDICR